MAIHKIRKIDGTGDTALTYDTEVETEVKDAQDFFDVLELQGYKGFATSGENKGLLRSGFDKTNEEIVMVPAIRGG